jgi:serine/threonine protein kinase
MTSETTQPARTKAGAAQFCATACPTEDDLVLYADDLADDALAEAIEAHLEHCDRCNRKIDAVERGRPQDVFQALRFDPDAATHRGRTLCSPGRHAPDSAREALARIEIGDTIADCRLLQLLGEGSFARVFLAEQTTMRRLVALKISTRRSLEPELLATLSHPHIVRVHHYDDRTAAANGLHLLYMQHVSGCSLERALGRLGDIPPANRSGRLLLEVIADELRQRGLLESGEGITLGALGDLDWPATVCWIGARLAHALDYADRLCVRHRDIKPANILLTSDGNPMLLDFSVSFGAEVEGARPEENFGGSLSYMSPEQLEAFHTGEGVERLEGLSDVYSLGVVLWEMLAGARPYGGETLQGATTLEIAAQLREADGHREAKPIAGDLPRDVDKLLAKCLAADASARPSAGALAQRLHLYSLPHDAQMLFPPIPQWGMRCLATSLYVLIFILANGILTALSVHYHSEFTVGDPPWDLDFLLEKETPIVIIASNLLGTALIVVFAWPALKAILRRRPEDDESRLEGNAAVGARCLTVGAFAGAVMLGLWIVVGTVLPAWNRISGSGSSVGWSDGLEFFIPHLLFGLLAAPIIFLAVTLAIVHELFPPLIPYVGAPGTRRVIPRVDRFLTWSTTMLALTPYVGLLALGLTGRVDNEFGLGLAAVGICGYVVAVLATPLIRSRLRLIDRALTPLREQIGSH